MTRGTKLAFRPERGAGGARPDDGRSRRSRGGPCRAGAGAHLATLAHRAEVREQRVGDCGLSAPEVAAASAAAHKPTLPPAGRPGIGPGLGHGLVRLALPFRTEISGSCRSGTTRDRAVNFSVSASTYANGQFFPFSLAPGQYRSFYASSRPAPETRPSSR